MVTTVVNNQSPLHEGDVITAINGVPTSDAIAQQLRLISPVGDWGMYTALTDLAEGRSGDTLKLTVKPISGDLVFDTEVKFSQHPSTTLAYQHEYRPDVVADLGGGIVYVDLTRLTQGAATRALSQLEAAKGIIFDMRGYPASPAAFTLLAHLSDTTLSTAPYGLPVVTVPDHRATQFIDDSAQLPAQAPRFTSNVAWLINANGTVSQAESVLSMVEGYKLGTLVGTPSAGADGDVVELALPGGYRIRWTGLRVTKFDGSPLWGVGVTPDVRVERTMAGVASKQDEILQRALAMVTQAAK